MRIALIGYGKMGRAIEKIAIEKGHEITLRIHRSNLHELTDKNLSGTDACIEFSTPASAYQNIKTCLAARIPVVCGTTGWTEKLNELRSFAEKNNTGFIYSSNFSIGVNLFFELNKKLASLMKEHNEYDVFIEEVHHTAKKDAPSGTAITIAEQILSNITRKSKWTNEVSNDKGDLQIVSKRIDPTPGTHAVRYASPIDTIEIVHTAHSREGFASGAVLAAEFLRDKSGFFTMKEVLQL